MVTHLAAEYQGFLKFLVRADRDLHRWFGPHCGHDPAKVTFMAAREWDGMADLERKPFIRSQNEIHSSNNSYIRYLLFNRYNKDETSSGEDNQMAFNPKSAKMYAQKWKSLPEEHRLRYNKINTYDHGINHVIKQRDKLHERYEPRKLCILEFILKTKPRWPSSSRMWFYRNECHSLASLKANEKWSDLNEEERSVYERCALIDRRRYEFEKSAWVTKILSIDLERDSFTFSDFDINEIRSKFDSLGSIVDISKDLPSQVGLRRPRSPFSLFIEAYRYQIRDERPEFQFGAHLRECSEAWRKLSEEERDFYKQQSKKLKEERRKLLATEPKADSRLTIPVDLFVASKSIHGPCRPAHLYPKLPSAMSIWAEENNIKASNVSKLWKNLPESTQIAYAQRRYELKDAIARQKGDIDKKHKYVKSLIREAVNLENFKQELNLIGASKKAVKNLYA